MPPAHATEGLQAAQVIREEQPGTAIVVLSTHVEADQAMDLLAGGERLGNLLKSRVTDVEEFIETVRRINAGASVVDPPWYANSSGPTGGMIRSTPCRRVNARCWP
jgi:DNA-binding NarL/FixJ family response regulator